MRECDITQVSVRACSPVASERSGTTTSVAGGRRRGRVGMLFVFLLAFYLVAVGAAGATFPGRNGKLVLTKDDGVYVVSADGRSERRLIRKRGTSNPQVSPDGRLIAFDTPDAGWIARMDGTGLRSLGTRTGAPSFSSDSRSILFARYTTDWGGIILRQPVSGGPTQVLHSGDDSGQEWKPRQSPDGRYLAYASVGMSGPGTVVVVDLQTRKEWYVQLREGYSLSPDWSPDGRNLAFGAYTTCHACGPVDLYIARRDNTGARKLVKDAGVPAFSPDGRLLAYVQHDRLFIRSLATGKTTRVPVRGVGGVAWQPLRR